MLVDARVLEPGIAIDADLCVVGAGAAGITLAREFIGRPVRVCVLESGGLEEEPRTRALSRGENVGLPYFQLHKTRSRVFGGSTNRWGGWCRPLDAADFEAHPWIPHSGWPISRGGLDPHYRRAASICQLEGPGFEPSAWGDRVPPLYRPPFVGGAVGTVIWMGSPPTKFGLVYRRELERAANVTVYLNANAVELEASRDAGALRGVRVACLGGPEFRVSAQIFVLAAGGLETPRLLLASSRVQAAGLGNQHGNVGRFFMEHPHVVTGKVVLDRSLRSRRTRVRALDGGITGFRSRLSLQRPVGGFKCAYTITEKTRREAGLLNFSTHLILGSLLRRQELKAYESLKLIVSNMRSIPRTLGQVRRRALPAGLGEHVKTVAANVDEVFRVAGDEVLRRPTELGLYTQAEQAPNPESRVMLADERDELGVPRLRLQWRLGEIDKASIRDAQRLVGERLESAGVGRLEPAEWLAADDTSWGESLQGGHHHMGTARMSRDPKRGVVDETCRVHGWENLYISDGSIFPTSGYANPLLTIVALSLRLAEHLKGRLASPDVRVGELAAAGQEGAR